jgi:ribosome-binding factor A
MSDTRHQRLQEALREGAAEFLSREAGRQSLVTVTRAMLSEDSKRVTVYITVLPESSEGPAVAFANRSHHELVKFLKTKVKGALPHQIEFEIDMGEKNRRRLDELST